MLTEQDYQTADKSLHIIRHVTDDKATAKLNFIEILEIIEFVTLAIKTIMFTKDGKPKNKWQLILSIPAIIKFAKAFIARLGKETNTQPASRKVAEQIEKSRATNARLRENNRIGGEDIAGKIKI